MVAMLATVCCGAVASKPGAPVDSTGAKKKKVTATREPTPPALPNGHVGQEYETRIGGVLLAAGEEPHCTEVAGLPAGLELNCKRMLIHGHPQAAVSEAPVSFTVGDDENHSVSVKFKLTVLDGPDVVQWVGTPGPAKTKPKQPQAAGGKATPPSPSAGVGGAGKHAAVAPMETEPESDRDVVASAPEAEAEPMQRRAAAVSHVMAAVITANEAKRPREGDGEGTPGHGSGGRLDHHPSSGVGIELDPETPFVEGATAIKGRVINDTERASELCVALRQRDGTLTEGGDRRSYAALTAVKGNLCLSVEAQVKDGEFSMGLTSPIKAGFKY